MGAHAKRQLQKAMIFAGGLSLGARLMYMLDPDQGRRRRAMARDRAVWLAHQAEVTLDRGARDLFNRAQGAADETLSLLAPKPVSDEVLVQRVRSKLGRATSHPHAIAVEAKDGCILLKGPVLQNEWRRVLWAVRGVPGVERVQNELVPHQKADIPDLQGGTPPPLPEILQETWAPATRALIGTAGGLLLAYGAWRRGWKGLGMGFLGANLLGRAVSNLGPRHLLGIGDAKTAGIRVQKTVHINVPVEAVFELLADPEKLPRIMSHLLSVKKTRDNCYRWTVSGPAGTPLSWDAEITQSIPNKVLAWRSLPGAMVANAGVVQLDTENGGTRVHIRVAYVPPAGAIGHVVAEFFGADPKHALDDDMVRLKSLLEHGKTNAHHHAVTLEEVVNSRPAHASGC
ncbi:MAG TPA: SRPBCC family protein [Terriglobales bacterium]|nr:SRPBCC family protein [Terriglobales bacterium]